MRSNIAKILRVLAIIIWILGFILGIVTGSAGSIDSFSYERTFNFWVTLLYWVMFFIIGVFYYAFGELVENVSELRGDTTERLDRMNDTLSRMATMMEIMGKSIIAMSSSRTAKEGISSESEPSSDAIPDYLFCPKCGNVVRSGSRACPNCGEDLSQYSAPKQPQPDPPVALPNSSGEYKKSEMAHPAGGQITCPNCGAVQLADRGICYKCGAKFID